MVLPNDFIHSLEKDYPLEYNGIANAITKNVAPTSIRFNTLKSNITTSEDAVLWNPHGVYLDKKISFTLDPHFHGGKYYVQEASSMFLYQILKQCDINENAISLDLCAAPGGKSTLIANFLKQGLLVSNEIIKSRANILKENVVKWGSGNIVVTNNEAKDFSYLNNYFDFILVDAPCSGEGMFRKDENAIGEWSLKNVEICSLRQRDIIRDILPCLKSNGYLIYSTCTYNKHENIENVKHFCNEYDLDSIELSIPEEWNILKISNNNIFGYQFLPNRLQGEGFFVSVLKKIADKIEFNKVYNKSHLQMLSKSELELVSKFVKISNLNLFKTNLGDVYGYNDLLAHNIHLLLDKLRVIYSGVKCGNVNKKVFIPDHALALSMNVNDEVNRVRLSKQEALMYLNKTLSSVSSDIQGWSIVSYEDTALGWIKNLGNRINNHYPSEWRIRMKIS